MKIPAQDISGIHKPFADARYHLHTIDPANATREELMKIARLAHLHNGEAAPYIDEHMSSAIGEAYGLGWWW